MRNNVLSVILLIIIILCFGVIGHYKGKINDISKADTITITRYDTLYVTDTFLLEKPKPYKVEVIKRDTLYTKDTTEVVLETEKTLYRDTLCQEGDTLYTELLISGINAKIEYAKYLLLKQRISEHSSTIINNYIEKKKKPTFKDRLFIAPSISVGYSPIHKDIDMVLGVSAGIKF